MSVLTLKLQEEDKDRKFLKRNRHHGEVVLYSEWSEVVAYNTSCQDNGSSG